MASTYLQRTVSSSGNQKKSTISAWFKRANNNTDGGLFSYTENGSNYFRIKFKGDILEIDNYYGGSQTMDLKTNRLYRDCSAWYHIVFAYDSAQGTASDRAKLYINGVQETSFSTASYPSQNGNIRLGNPGSNIELGRSQGPQYFDGIISHVHYCDGYAYAASDFGETDSTTGEWKIKTSPSVSYGSNGFFWLKDSIATTDHSPNSNTFTVGGGTLTKTEDCPSNVFCTLNKLSYAASLNYTFKYGNTAKDVTNTTNTWRTAYGTMGATSGKYYWEVKITGDESGDLGNMFYGIINAEQMVDTSNNGYFTTQTHGYGYHAKTGNAYSNNTGNSYGASITTNDILGVAVDLDNNKIYFAKNGTWQNSGNPASGSTGTGSAFTLASGITYLPAFAQYYGAEQYAVNFGNGYFQATAVSSAGTNASGIGIFEYDVPTGYTALSTKGLNL